jgi:ribonuclease HI
MTAEIERIREQSKPSRQAALMREPEDEVVFATMHFDGGGQTPGPIGGGVVIELADGREHESSFYLLEGTHNVAEYKALAHGLDCVLRLGVTHVNIFGDSRLVVEQVNGRWRCRNSALDQLRRAVMSKLDSLESWSLKWTPRTSNRRAGRARDGRDQRGARVVAGKEVGVDECVRCATTSRTRRAEADDS